MSIKLQTDYNIDDFKHTHLKSLQDKCEKKSIVIFLSSKTCNKVSIYWKFKELENFFTLKHYGENYSENDKKIYEFVAEFLVKSLSKGELGELIPKISEKVF